MISHNILLKYQAKRSTPHLCTCLPTHIHIHQQAACSGLLCLFLPLTSVHNSSTAAPRTVSNKLGTALFEAGKGFREPIRSWDLGLPTKEFSHDEGYEDLLGGWFMTFLDVL